MPKNSTKNVKGNGKASAAAREQARLAALYAPGTGYAAPSENSKWRRVCVMSAGEYAALLGLSALPAKDCLRGEIGRRTHEIHRYFVDAYANGKSVRYAELESIGLKAVSPHLNTLKIQDYILPVSGAWGDGKPSYIASGREYALSEKALDLIRANNGLVAGDGLLCKPAKPAKRKSK